MKMLKRQVLNPLHILAQHLFVVILRIIVYLTKNFVVLVTNCMRNVLSLGGFLVTAFIAKYVCET